jgi:hypothetical protein
MEPKTNPNYKEGKDGFWKSDTSVQKGNADYFSRPIPPVRDGATGHPIGSNGKIDWARVIREANERE